MSDSYISDTAHLVDVLVDLSAGVRAEDRTSFDDGVQAAAEAILWGNLGHEWPGVDWPSDLHDATAIARIVLEVVGWQPTRE